MALPDAWTNLEPERIRILGEIETLRGRALAALPDSDHDDARLLAGIIEILTVVTGIVLGTTDAEGNKALQAKAPWQPEAAPKIPPAD